MTFTMQSFCPPLMVMLACRCWQSVTSATHTHVKMEQPATHWPTEAMSVSVHQHIMDSTASTRLMHVMEIPVETLAPVRSWRLAASGKLFTSLNFNLCRI